MRRSSLVTLLGFAAACSGAGASGGDAGPGDARTAHIADAGTDAGSARSVCGSWRTGPALLDQRESSPTLLLDDGRVLLVAGHFDNRTGDPLNSSEIVDVETGTSTFTGTFSVPRTITGQGGTVKLLDGRVLSGSPFLWQGEPPIAAEIWDPATSEWTLTGTQAVGGGPAVTLPDGRVLVAGGIDWNIDQPLARAEIYDPATGVFADIAPLSTPRTGHALLVVGGRALAIGGFDVYPEGDALASVEAFDPIEHVWQPRARLSEPRGGPAVAILSDGRLLVAGGTAASGGYKPELASAEIYDPEADAWEPVAPMQQARAGFTLTPLPDGRVLAAGGSQYSFSASTTAAEIYDPETDRWSATASLERSRRFHGAALLASGDVLIAGGYPGGVRSSELFTLCD